MSCLFFFFNDTATTEIYTLSLHDALPISDVFPILRREGDRIDNDLAPGCAHAPDQQRARIDAARRRRSEEHTSELQSPCNLVCRLLLEKKKKKHELTINVIYSMLWWTILC